MSFSLASVAPSSRLTSSRLVARRSAATGPTNASVLNELMMRRLNENTGMGNGGLKNVDDERQQNDSLSMTNTESSGFIYNLQKGRTQVPKKQERLVRFHQSRTTGSPKPALGLQFSSTNSTAPICSSEPSAQERTLNNEQPEASSEDYSRIEDHDESGLACERVRSVIGLGVDMSTYSSASPYSVFLASLPRYVPRRLLHRPQLHVGERETNEHKEQAKEQELLVDLQKNYTSNSSIADEKQPWEYVGEMEFDFDTEEFAGPAFGFGTISYRPRARSTARPPLHLNGHLNPNSNNTSVQESATALRSFHRSRGVSSVPLSALDRSRLLLAQAPGPSMQVPSEMRALADSLGLKLTHPAQIAYLFSCRAFSESPCRQILVGMAKAQLHLVDYELSHNAFLPVCISFQVSPQITILRLMGNNLGEEGAKQLAEVIAERILQLKELIVRENNLRAAGLKHIVDAILSSPGIEIFDVSGNFLSDPGAIILAQFIKSNLHVVELRASNNEFFDSGLQELSRAIGKDRSIRMLDLSWNHIRLKGAIYLLDALTVNTKLENVNLSWNGLSMWETKKLCNFFRYNTSIKTLDISNNRLDNTSLEMITNFGIIKNQTIETLKIGGNPLTQKGIKSMLQSVLRAVTGLRFRPFSLINLDVTGTPIDDHCEQEAKQIAQVTKQFFLTYYQFVKSMKQTEENEDVFHNEDPMMVLIEYLKMKNLRLLDLFKSLDSNGSHSINHKEFRVGLTNMGVPLTTTSVNRMIDMLDRDGDGEIDYMEFLMGQREHSRRLQIVKLAEKDKPFEETELGRIQIKLKHTLARREEKRRIENIKKREARAVQQGLAPVGQTQGGYVSSNVGTQVDANGAGALGAGSGGRPTTSGKGPPGNLESQSISNSRPTSRVDIGIGSGSQEGFRNGSRSSSRMRSRQAALREINTSKRNSRTTPVKHTSVKEMPLETN